MGSNPAPARHHHHRPPTADREVQAELRETPHGWVLTLRADAGTAGVLRDSGLAALRPSEISVRVLPNLVPAEPFPLAAVRVLVEE